MLSFKVFRVLSYVLIPVACFFGLMGLLILIPALANPSMWLILFLFASMVIYTFSCLKFLTRGIERNAPCKRSLKDWIRVNAYVCLVMGGMFFLNAIGILMLGPVGLQELVERAIESQPNLPEGMNVNFFASILKTIAGFMLAISILIISHVILCFSMLKKFGYLFRQ